MTVRMREDSTESEDKDGHYFEVILTGIKKENENLLVENSKLRTENAKLSDIALAPTGTINYHYGNFQDSGFATIVPLFKTSFQIVMPSKKAKER